VAYGYTGPLHDAEYDHLISLQLGGDPNDPRNPGPNHPLPATEPELDRTTPKTPSRPTCTPRSATAQSH
jgi:hypothetical protein